MCRMVLRSDVSPAARRLCSLLARWTGSSVTALASRTGVDKSNLSRFLRRPDSPNISASKLASLLVALGWEGRRPTPQVHHWAVDDRLDMEWLFGEVMEGRVSLTALFRRQADVRDDGHEGVVLGSYAGSVMVLRQALLPKGLSGHLDDDLLTRLLDRTRPLALVQRPRVVLSTDLWSRLGSEEVTSDELRAFLLNAPASVPASGDLVKDLLDAQRSLWLTNEEARHLLLDGYARFARKHPQRLSQALINGWRAAFEVENASPAPQRLELEWKSRAKFLVDEASRRPYLLTWT